MAKVEVTDLKAPNVANDTVDNATEVQVKLWINKDDVDAPDILETDATITGGVLSVLIDPRIAPAVDGSAVVGTNTNTTQATSTTFEFAHTGGLMLVGFNITHPSFTTLAADVDVTATFDGAAMTLVRRQRSLSWNQFSIFAIQSVAKTANLVFTTTNNFIRRAVFAVSCGDGDVNSSASGAASSSATITSSVTSTAEDIVLQFAVWFNSVQSVSSYGTGQTVVLSDDAPTRIAVSQKQGDANSTTVTTTLDTATDDVTSLAVSISPSGIGSVGDPVLGVAKWTVATDDYFFPIDTTVQEVV